MSVLTNSDLVENTEYLQNQLITYIGNKRALLPFIGQAVKIVQEELNKDKLDCLDIFSGSGIVARFLKQFSKSLTVNDLETYSAIINRCYLSNQNEIDLDFLKNKHKHIRETVAAKIAEKDSYEEAGFISTLYSPKNADNITKSDRCFYTPYNAAYIDYCRQEIEKLPENIQPYFIAPLLSEASIHANTAGIFKGFYKNSKTGAGQFGGNGKNALSRILGKIDLPFPVFSDFNCSYRIFNQNANELVNNEDLYSLCEEKEFDLAYFDPPYNQHPYGSNYFMLNLIASYEKPDTDNISRVSGIPKNWNRSSYNKKKQVAAVFYDLVNKVRAKYVLISFNSEGFISKEEMTELLSQCGTVRILEEEYNAFRGSRNLKDRDIHVKEFLFLVQKY